MKAEELRRSVLQLAVEGKLVEQRPEEGTAKELLAEIAAERERLVCEGKMKRSKPLAPVSPDEVPFEIPESWEWVRLGDLGTWAAGGTPSRTNSHYYLNGTVPWVKSGDLTDNVIDFTEEKITFEATQETRAVINSVGSVVIALYGATIGKTGVLAIPAATNQACCVCTPLSGIYNWYLNMYLLSQKEVFRRMGSGSAQPNISREKVIAHYFPLPPLAEQRRIVARLEELMPLIDAYDAEERRLSALETEFPEQLRRSLLQYAVEGKLVEQRPGEGTARELLAEIAAERERLIREGKMKRSKPLAPVSQDEVPFEIPESWEWINIEQICSHITDGEHIKPQTTNLSNGIPLLMAKNVRESHLDFTDIEYISTENAEKSWKRCYPEKHDILICSRGASVGRSLVINSDKKFCLMGTVILLKPLKNKINSEFLNLYLKTEYAQYTMKTMCGATAQGALYLNGIKKIILPLPPLAEQRRIVARLEELMPLIDRIHTPVNVTAEKEK